MTTQAPAGSSQFPIGLSPRTMQDFSSVQYLGFLEVSSFPIGLSPRTMQYLGSVQYLGFFGSIQFPHRLYLGSVSYLGFFGSIQFPHRFKSEDHARPWFCLVLRIFPQYKTDNHNGPKNLNQGNIFVNNNTFSGNLHSRGEVQLFHLSPLSSMHLFPLLK